MIALIQRVRQAQVDIENQTVAKIGAGMAVLVCAEHGDTREQATRLLDKLLALRIFSDEQGKMNLNLQQAGGQLLLVSQFTLAADTRKGNRPGFSRAAPPAISQPLFDELVAMARTRLPDTQCGVFGADMQLSLTNDGPVTIPIHIASDTDPS
ncbi:D-aminoacyl-tRNA deacylase [Alcaligenes faecalis]|uniref:D-aminoacyl-tRNA deacylase n=1 Tax=Alcaligenes faecalis TaxID=511 RepID=UPI000E17B8A0|nr:D-aminoacyl-tRNA deacylase [Alcaligenes faecalis]SUU82021.1 D-tyrosyl-tRNA(Tyr) deacylase [Alcaligenes faecalis subsp. faecalis]